MRQIVLLTRAPCYLGKQRFCQSFYLGYLWHTWPARGSLPLSHYLALERLLFEAQPTRLSDMKLSRGKLLMEVRNTSRHYGCSYVVIPEGTPTQRKQSKTKTSKAMSANMTTYWDQAAVMEDAKRTLCYIKH